MPPLDFSLSEEEKEPKKTEGGAVSFEEFAPQGQVFAENEAKPQVEKKETPTAKGGVEPAARKAPPSAKKEPSAGAAKALKTAVAEKGAETVNKVGMVEYFLWGGTLFTVDVICFVADFTGVGDFITPFAQTLFTGGVSGWFWLFKGSKESVKLEKMLTKSAANILPWVPTLTIAFFVEAYIHNHPKLKEITQVASVKK